MGAILSDYQRVRVENVCSRLNLISLAYLWRRDQTELLQEMIDCQVHAIIIKVRVLPILASLPSLIPSLSELILGCRLGPGTGSSFGQIAARDAIASAEDA